MHAAYAGNFAHVRAKFFVLLVVRAFAGKIQVVFGEHRRECVRIVSLEYISVAEANRRRYATGGTISSVACRGR